MFNVMMKNKIDLNESRHAAPKKTNCASINVFAINFSK
ncbi:MAG: hypothetical protein JWQ40_3587 [Segetibacter sp.]|nr:hypothetical protein [Segetibacter sp.]